MEQEFKGTKGNWTICKSNSNRDFIEAKDCGDGGDVICTSPIKDISKLSYERWDANSHLIASAPELLQACIDAFNFIENNLIDASQSSINSISDTLQNAIHKALNIK